MGSYLSVPILAIAAMLQATVLPLLFGGGAIPNVVFVFVLAWSINGSVRQNSVWALTGGILLDLFSILPLGTRSIALLLMVMIVTGLGDRVYRIGILWLVALTTAGTVYFEMYTLVIGDIFRALGVIPSSVGGLQQTWLNDFNTVVIPTMIYNLVLIGLVYLLVRWMQRRIAPPV